MDKETKNEKMIAQKSAIKKNKSENIKRIQKNDLSKKFNTKSIKSENASNSVIKNLIEKSNLKKHDFSRLITKKFLPKSSEKIREKDSTHFENKSLIVDDENNKMISQNDCNENNDLLLIEEYEENIISGPKYVCVCCGSLEFFESVEIFFENNNLNGFESKVFCLKKKYFDNDYHWICKVCTSQIRENKIPKMALSNSLDFPVIDENIKNLTELEERLCSPRVAFLKIRQLNIEENANGNFSLTIFTNKYIKYIKILIYKYFLYLY